MEEPAGPRPHEAAVGPEESRVVAVVRAVAAVSGTPVGDLPPLGNVVDPDALDGIFPTDRDEGRVTFDYDGYVVTVRADDIVVVEEGDRS